MKTTILAIAGDGNEVRAAGKAVQHECSLSGRSVLTLRGLHGTGTDAELSDGEIPWRYNSIASARSILQLAENRAGGLPEELVILVGPDQDSPDFAGSAPRDIEAAFAQASATAQLTQEAWRRFAQRGSGRCVIALWASPKENALAAMVQGSVAGLAEGVLSSLAAQAANAPKKSEGPRFMAAKDESGQPELFARFVLKMLEDTGKDTYRIVKHGGKPSLFGRI